MTTLTSEKCVACRPDAPRVTPAEIAELKPQIPDWKLTENNGIQLLEREFRFPNFAASLAFANTVGEFAETEGHHPAILIEWGRVTIRWWTNKIGGLHRNDFISAAKTDKLYEEFASRRT